MTDVVPTNTKPTMEDYDSDDEVALDVENVPATGDEAAILIGTRKNQSRNEKKARKALSRMGLKPVPGIVRVTVRRSRNAIFALQNPDVYHNPATNTYVVFGEPRVDDYAAQYQANAAEQLAKLAVSEAATTEAAADGAAAAAPASPPKDKGKVPAAAPAESAAGVHEKDIELVMQQADVDRAAAIRALRDNNNDLVNAIMDLTK